MRSSVILSAILCAALGGCSVIDKRAPVPGWPELKVVEHHVSHDVMRDRCAPTVSAFLFPEACTYFDLDKGEAHIYVSKDFPSAWVLEHERWHALGYDHYGSTSMRRMVEAWRLRKAKDVQ